MSGTTGQNPQDLLPADVPRSLAYYREDVIREVIEVLETRWQHNGKNIKPGAKAEIISKCLEEVSCYIDLTTVRGKTILFYEDLMAGRVKL